MQYNHKFQKIKLIIWIYMYVQMYINIYYIYTYVYNVHIDTYGERE